MMKLFKGIILLMFLMLLPAIALAEKITLVYEAYPPYEFVEGGKIMGTDVDIINEACKRIGCEVEFLDRPWKRAVEEVKDGKVDGIFSLFKTDERDAFLFFPTESLSFEKNIIIAKKGKGIKAAKVEDLKGKSVGVVVDYSYGDAFDAYKDIKREVCKDNEELLKKLDTGRMDVAIVNELVYGFLAKKMGLKGKFEVVYQQSLDPMFIGFSKAKGEKAKKLAADFSKAISDMRKKGDIKNILQKY
jgi:polar amino acid transport system substrate-binding protein